MGGGAPSGGLARNDTARQVQLLNPLYRVYSLYVNYFPHAMKLWRKERQGSHIKRSDEEYTMKPRRSDSTHGRWNPRKKNSPNFSENFFDGESGTRTHDLTIMSRLLYQLSYLAGIKDEG